MSFFLSKGKAATNGPQFHSTAERYEDASLFGQLEPSDLCWTCAGGFVTETQVFYNTLPTGQIIMFQLIHSAVGLWKPNIQLTFGYFDPQNPTKKREWKSINVSNFKCPADPKTADRRSVKGDQFSIIAESDDTYVLEGNYDGKVQVSLRIQRLSQVPGWKAGTGPRGGISYFGNLASEQSKNPDIGAGSDGYVVHRFWPRTTVTGIVRIESTVIDVNDQTRGIFIHAIQGMRPNLIASRWNFADFQSSAADQTSLAMMEFTTTSTHGHKVVNVGSIVVEDKLVAVTASSQRQARHQNTFLDADTGYHAPQQIDFKWSGPLIGSPGNSVTAHIHLDLVEGNVPSLSKGLAEKVDVMAEIPYFIKKVVNVVSGAKPYIYQWLNPAEATIELPAHQDTPARSITVRGHLFNEASYVSETP